MTRRRQVLAAIGAVAVFAASAWGAPGGGPFPAPVATPDTTDVEFLPSGAGAAPVAVHALADTVSFGGVLDVAWDLPAGADAATFRAPVSKGDQLVTVPAGAGDAGRGAAGAGLPASAGPRVVAKYRVYATDAVRLAWKGQRTKAVVVKGRVTDPQKTAAIRDPRPWPWLTWTLALVLLGAAALAAAAWWLWRRVRRKPGPGDWPLPEPAWIQAALACADLLAARQVERGDQRAFLDGLAAVARRFVAAHYGIAGQEMTGPELVAACAARGHEPALPAALARLIDGADLRRYDPQAPTPEWCRAQVAEFVQRLDEARVIPRLTPVAADRLLAAQKAWAELTAVAAGGGR